MNPENKQPLKFVGPKIEEDRQKPDTKIEKGKLLEFERIEATEENLELLEKLEADCYLEKGQAWGKDRFNDLFEELDDFYVSLEKSGTAEDKKVLLPLKSKLGCYLIKRKGESIGATFLIPRESNFNPGEKVIYIAEMMILSRYRQGLGRAVAGLAVSHLIERLKEITATNNVGIETKARASTSYEILSNESVQGLLQGSGFIGGPVETADGGFAAVRAEKIKTEKGEETLKEEKLNLTEADLKMIGANPAQFYNYYIWYRIAKKQPESQEMPLQKAA